MEWIYERENKMRWLCKCRGNRETDKDNDHF